MRLRPAPAFHGSRIRLLQLYGGFPKIRGTIVGVPIIRMIVLGGLFGDLEILNPEPQAMPFASSLHDI